MDRPEDRLILVTGGARSGKSTFAERLAAKLAEPSGGRVLYLATSETNDAEMTARVAAHRAGRPDAWTTVECPVDVAAALRAAVAGRGGNSPPSAGEAAGPAGRAGPTGARPVVLLDCVTFWTSNLMFSVGGLGGTVPPDEFNYDKSLLSAEQEGAVTERITAAAADLLAALDETGVTLVAVTNEVGLGVVPEYPLARLWRDQLGWMNQRLARAADRVYLLVSGFPLDVKALAAPWPEPTPYPSKESQ